MAKFRITAENSIGEQREIVTSAPERKQAVNKSLRSDETLVSVEKRVSGEWKQTGGMDPATDQGTKPASAASSASANVATPLSAIILMAGGVIAGFASIVGAASLAEDSTVLAIEIGVTGVVAGAMLFGVGQIIELLNSIQSDMRKHLAEVARNTRPYGEGDEKDRDSD